MNILNVKQITFVNINVPLARLNTMNTIPQECEFIMFIYVNVH